MKKNYLTLAIALFSVTLAFGQAPIEYDFSLTLTNPVHGSAVEKTEDPFHFFYYLKNVGTTTIHIGDTFYLSYGRLHGDFYPVDLNRPEKLALDYIIQGLDIAPGDSLTGNLIVPLTPFSVGDTVVVTFRGVGKLEGEQNIQTQFKDINLDNNSQWFKLTGACDIKGADTVCQGKTITLEGIPAGGTWTQDDSSIGEASSTGVVTGKKAGTVKISYSASTCTGTKEHSVVVDDKCPASSIEEFANATFNAYPNPAGKTLYIQSLETIQSVSILSLDGKVISTTYGTKIDVSDLKSGVYFYKVTTTKGEIAVSKLVKE